MDGAKFSSVEIAINKAFTSSGAGARATTRPSRARAAPRSACTRSSGPLHDPGRGVPVVVDGQIVGAVGISSGAAGGTTRWRAARRVHGGAEGRGANDAGIASRPSRERAP
jgi:uncharacterized protein GlcG (DUF336 family)